jgi:ABC-2 type transport system permease protein
MMERKPAATAPDQPAAPGAVRAGWLGPLVAQTLMELRLTARRGENLLVTLAIPLALLLFFGSTGVFAASGQRPVDFLAPGILALAIMSTGMVSLGIATAYERHYGVLKRLGGTPLGRPRLIAAKIIAVLVVEAVQVALIAAVARLAFDWRPAGSPAAALGPAALGTVAFAGLGLAMAGRLRAEAVLALANGLYLLLLLSGGFFLPLEHLPPVIAAVAPWLPAAALAELLRAALAGAPLPPVSLAVLAGWALAAVATTVATFRWE